MYNIYMCIYICIYIYTHQFLGKFKYWKLCHQAFPSTKGWWQLIWTTPNTWPSNASPKRLKVPGCFRKTFVSFQIFLAFLGPAGCFFLANSPFANIPAAAILAHLHSHPNSSRFFRNVRLGRLHRDDGESHQGCGAARQGDQVQMGLLPARLIAREYPLKRIALESPRCFSSWHIGIVHCSRVPQPIEFPLDVWVTWFWIQQCCYH